MLRKEETTVKVCTRLPSSKSCCSSHWLDKEGLSIQLANSHAEPNVFDYFFNECSTNQDVFDRMARHISTSMQGFDETILAYGQTLSGKTYTMMGDGKNPGLIVLVAKKIFQMIAMEPSRDFLLRASYIQIYDEKINKDELMRLICPGNKGRTVGEAQTQMVTDGIQINNTLMFLSNVVKHLSDNNPEKNACISFRDCKLARFLQASLCGNCFTSIICTIRPATISEIKKLRDQQAEEKQKKDNKLKVQILESKLVAEKLKIISSQPVDAVRRRKSSTSIKAESPRAGILKTSRLPRPKFDFDFRAGRPPLALAHNTKSTGTDDLPTGISPYILTQLVQKCADLQAEVSALTAHVKSLYQTMENNIAVDLEQKLNSHKAQDQHLEIHLLTSINGGDLTIDELKRSFNNLSRLVLRIDNMQADFLAIQQKYHSLEEKYKYLECSSQASEEECQQLQADNKSLRLEIGALKERAEGTQRMLLEASSQEAIAEDFKAKLECQTTELVIYQVSFKGFQGVCECLSNQLSESVKDNNVLQGELRSMKASVVSTQPGRDTHDDLLEQDNNIIAKLKDASGQIDNNSLLSEISRLFSNQRQKLTDNALRIDQLQNRCENLTESLKQAEARQEQTISSSEYEKQIKELRESLREAKDELKLKEKQKTDDELENRAKFRAHTLESQESKDQYESEVAKLKKQLLRFEEELSRVSDRCQAEKAELRQENNTLKEKLLEAAENKKQMDVAHSMELKTVMAGLRDQLGQAEDERNKALDELASMRSSQEEYSRHKKETQLEAVSNEHKELMTSQEPIQELQQKYNQIAIYADNLREEKSILQVKIDEADARHSSTLRKLHELEVKMYDLSKQKVKEKSNFEEKLETMTAKISFLKQELQSARLRAAWHDDLFSEHKDVKLSFSKATGAASTLQEKVDSLQSQFVTSKTDISSRDLEVEKLRSDLKLTLEAKDTASAEKLALTSKLQVVEQRMASQAGNFKKELADLHSSTIDLQLKLKSLEERKHNLESENDQLKVKLKNAHNLQNQLEEGQKLCASLRTQFDELKATKVRLEEQLQIKEAEVNRKFLEMNQRAELDHHSIEKLTKECDQLRCDLQTKTNSLLKERDGLASTISTLSKENKLLKERISSLNLNSNSSNRNTELITKLRAKEADLESLQEALTSQKFAAEAANVKCRHFMKQKVEFTNEIEHLQTTLKSKEATVLAERDSLKATNSSLLEDKRNLEEKQCTLYERVGKLEEELLALQAINITKCNSSVGTNGPIASQISMKPLFPNNLDPKPSVCAGVIKKSSIIESAVRRERRKTAHDEHRKQSYWNDFRDFGTMTDPDGEHRRPSLKFDVHSGS